LFYELRWYEPGGNTIFKRNEEPSPPSTFQGDLDTWAQITLLVDPDASFKSYQSAPVQANVKVVESMAAIEGFVPRLLPDGYFYPQHYQGKLIDNATT
jgi:hypothetical protein